MTWDKVKDYLFKFFGGLFMDDRNGSPCISLGRVLLLAVMVQMFIFWHRESEMLPDGLMEVFYAMTGYVFGSKAVGMVKDWIAPKPPELPTTEELKK
jgi:hypothetical protein